MLQGVKPTLSVRARVGPAVTATLMVAPVGAVMPRLPG